MTFTIPGEPCGKGRPRVVNVHGRSMSYTPEKTATYENLVRLEFQQAAGPTIVLMSAAEVRMTINCYYGLAKSDSKKRRMAKLTGEERPTKKPDCDNMGKAIADALNGLAYRDDSQIVSMTVEKWYSETPHVDVTIQYRAGADAWIE